MQLLLATTNKGKVIEIRDALASFGFDIKTPTDFGITKLPDEHGTTYHANAIIKASYYHKLTGIPTIADDSGILVEALQDELGVHTRRWGAGTDASDEEWIHFFLNRMKNEKNRKAQFVCSLALIDAEATLRTFEGICEGIVTETLESDYLPGLPLSACFKPDGSEGVYSAMNVEQKNSTSHRGKALRKLRDFFECAS